MVWVNELMDSLMSSSMTQLLSITRRSAGLPFYVQVHAQYIVQVHAQYIVQVHAQYIVQVHAQYIVQVHVQCIVH